MDRRGMTAGLLVAAAPLATLAVFAGGAMSAGAGAAGPVAGGGATVIDAPFIPEPQPPAVAAGAATGTSMDVQASRNWSGYAVKSTHKFTDVEGSWVQPAVTCGNQGSAAAFWVGIDGFGTPSVEQIGTVATCSGGTALYQAWYEMYPQAPVYLSDPVAPGDTLTGDVHRAGDTYTLTLKSSAGWTASTKQTGSYDDLTAEWIAEAPSVGSDIEALARFTTAGFSGAEAAETGGGDQPITAFADGGTDPVAITLGSGSDLRALPSELADGGTAFTVFRTPGIPAALAVTVQPPADVKIDHTFDVQVAVEDSSGDVVTDDDDDAVSLALTGSGPTTATLLCQGNPATVTDGIANLTCTVDRVGTGYTLTASSGAYTTATSTAFTVVADH